MQIKDGRRKFIENRKGRSYYIYLETQHPFHLFWKLTVVTHLNYKVSLIFRKSRKCWMVLPEMCT